VTFAGFLPRADYLDVLARARAMVFAGCEDFGIALVEAQGCGTPLIAFGRGGATDIVRPLGLHQMPTGVLFHKQASSAVVDAVERFEANADAIIPSACRENAARFGPQRFARQVTRAFAATVAMHDNFSAERTPDWRTVLKPGADSANASKAVSVYSRT
jgi:glycosyltransferase involved in cell wall biosynthesis